MVAGIFHQGSGLGNQLHRYVATRVLAEDKGYEWGMMGPREPFEVPAAGLTMLQFQLKSMVDQDLFKGRDFMSIDLGKDPHAHFFGEDGKFKFDYLNLFKEKKVVENGVDIRSYDPEFNFVKDNTIIDGEFQDIRYFEHRLSDIRKWLAVEPLNMRDDLCVIGFRGGEYTIFPDLYLTKDYWRQAIEVMEARGINKFEVHTDDPTSAKAMLSDLVPENTTYTHDIGLNWRSVRHAKHLIIANSSFFIFPSLLNEDVEEVIAPRYWARRSANPPVWAQPQNYYPRFTYI